MINYGVSPGDLLNNDGKEDDGHMIGEESEDEGSEGPGGDEVEVEMGEEEGKGEEGMESLGLCKPCMPGMAEVESHNRTHIPFRPWCEICVFGRAENLPHKAIKELIRAFRAL